MKDCDLLFGSVLNISPVPEDVIFKRIGVAVHLCFFPTFPIDGVKMDVPFVLQCSVYRSFKFMFNLFGETGG